MIFQICFDSTTVCHTYGHFAKFTALEEDLAKTYLSGRPLMPFLLMNALMHLCHNN